MEVFETITQLVSNMGFPIAMVAYLLIRDAKKDERHAEESKGFIEAISNNTKAMEILSERIGRD